MNTLFSIAEGRYLLADVIGEGGMATVYRGFDTRLGVWRAVKVLSPHYSAKKKLISRFDSEARTMALLEHKNIVRVYDVGHVDGVAFIVMECVEGGALVDWIEAHGAMPAALALSVTIEVARAIEYAHANGVIHRDIKPHNVLVHTDGGCRVTDFGIARLSDDQMSMTKTGAVMGTWGYMAPEQRTDAKGVDARADVYALGATLYSLLTNRIPVDLFAADRDPSLMKDVSDDLASLIMKATQYSRDDRFDSVRAFRVACSEAMEALEAVDTSHPPLVQSSAEKHRPPLQSELAEAIPLTLHWAQEQQRLTGAQGQTLMPMDHLGAAYAPTMAPGEWGALETMDAPPAPQAAVPLTEIPVSSERVRPLEKRSRSPMLWVLALSPGALGLILGVVALFILVPKLQGTPEAIADEQTQDTTDRPADGAPQPPVEPVVEVTVQKETPPNTRQGRRRTTQKQPVEEPVVTPVIAPILKTTTKKQCLTITKKPSGIQNGETVGFVVRLCHADRKPDVTLVYRPLGTGAPWQKRKMTNLAGQYRFAVKINETYGKGMEFYIETKGATYGTASNPKTIPSIP